MGSTSPGRVATWRWLRWTRWPLTQTVVMLAAVTVAFDVATAWAGFSLGHLGRIPVSPTLPLEAVLVLAVGPRRLGLDRVNLAAWREFIGIAGGALVFGVYEYSVHIGGFREAAGLVLAALDEELVYRLAVLVLVGAVTARLMGRNWRNAESWGTGPGVVALLSAGLVFTLLPGHLAQVTDSLHAVPFACLGVLLGYAVLRTGALFPAAVVHALLNLATIAALSGQMSLVLRGALSATALVALLLGTMVAGRRLGLLRPELVPRRGAAAIV